MIFSTLFLRALIFLIISLTLIVVSPPCFVSSLYCMIVIHGREEEEEEEEEEEGSILMSLYRTHVLRFFNSANAKLSISYELSNTCNKGGHNY